MFLKHGHYAGGHASPTYTSWQNMRTRCQNLSDPTYPQYGGRGITVCRAWADFERFLKDMGERPAGMTLDRKNNEKGYYKENCRWATAKQQQQNRRVNKLLTYNGETYCLAQWAQRLGHSVQILKGRIRRGWSVELALSIPSCGPDYRRTRIK